MSRSREFPVETGTQTTVASLPPARPSLEQRARTPPPSLPRNKGKILLRRTFLAPRKSQLSICTKRSRQSLLFRNFIPRLPPITSPRQSFRVRAFDLNPGLFSRRNSCILKFIRCFSPPLVSESDSVSARPSRRNNYAGRIILETSYIYTAISWNRFPAIF